MGRYRSAILKQAQSWLGCNEADGSHKKIIDVYNSHKPWARGYKMPYNVAWCSCFVSAVAIKCGYTDIIPTEVGCGPHIELFKKLGIWIEDDSYVPKPADIILYDWEDNGKGDNAGYPNHIGIVEKCENGKITVIEGNYSNAVKRRTLAVNGKYIRGFAVPKYDAEPAQEPAASGVLYRVQVGAFPQKANAEAMLAKLKAAGFDGFIVSAVNEKSVDELAREVLRGDWGTGDERKQKLTAAGYDYSAVQKRVNELLKG